MKVSARSRTLLHKFHRETKTPPKQLFISECWFLQTTFFFEAHKPAHLAEDPHENTLCLGIAVAESPRQTTVVHPNLGQKGHRDHQTVETHVWGEIYVLPLLFLVK